MSLIRQFCRNLQFINRVVTGKTEGLTHEDSMKQLSFPGNCMNWNIGHLLVYRERYLDMLTGSSMANEVEFAIYGAGSEPLTDSETAVPLETLLTRFTDVSAKLIAALEAMPLEKLDEVIDAENNLIFADRLSFYLMFHESFHAGQLEILRELALADK